MKRKKKKKKARVLHGNKKKSEGGEICSAQNGRKQWNCVIS